MILCEKLTKWDKLIKFHVHFRKACHFVDNNKGNHIDDYAPD